MPGGPLAVSRAGRRLRRRRVRRRQCRGPGRRRKRGGGAAAAGHLLRASPSVVVVDLETGGLVGAGRRETKFGTHTHSADRRPCKVLRVERRRSVSCWAIFMVRAGLEFRSDRGVYLDGRWVVVEAEAPWAACRCGWHGGQEIIVGQNRTLSELAEYGARVMLEVRP